MAEVQNERDKYSIQINKISENNKNLKTEIEQLRTEQSQSIQSVENNKQILETQNISGSLITIHYSEDFKENVTKIEEMLSKLGAKITLNPLKENKHEIKHGHLYYFPGRSSLKTAEQIKAVVAPIDTIEIVESKFWWLFQNKDRLNLWFTIK